MHCNAGIILENRKKINTFAFGNSYDSGTAMTKTEKILLLLTALFLALALFLLPKPQRGVYRVEETFRLSEESADEPDGELPLIFVMETRVDLNTADEKELVALPGIGKTLAARIIAYREEHGPFHTVEELLNVEGVTASTLEMLYERTTPVSGAE